MRCDTGTASSECIIQTGDWCGLRAACDRVTMRPKTLVAWHRKGFCLFWRWKSEAGRRTAAISSKTPTLQNASL